MNWVRGIIWSLIALLGVSLQAAENDKSEYQFIGRHFIASYHDCNHEALVNIDVLKQKLIEAAKSSGAQILSASDYVFAPDGLTMVLLLSESHASIHTYPEHNACFVDLFTCGDRCSAEKFDHVLREYLQPAKVHEKVIARK